ncbi:MAG: asparagine synthetase B [Chlorobi bacterium]|nr:asparagine synthetase B [Chlorobiota bacterium]
MIAQKKIIIFLLFLVSIFYSNKILGNAILIPMDESQKNHLKAYGITYWVLQNGLEANWLLNYRGGSFTFDYVKDIADECIIRGVSYEVISDAELSIIYNRIASPEVNMDKIKLEKAPKIAVYSPEGKQPWDDAVTLVLTYAEIKYDRIYDKEIVNGELSKYDWLHLHHEDFTGQYGKFYGAYRYASWYKEAKKKAEADAQILGFNKVSKLKLFVAKRIKEYVFSGGFLFAMCSATDSYDIALAAENTDICESMFDGDPADPNCQEKLDFSKTLAFKDFTLVRNPMEYEFSNIDATQNKTRRSLNEKNDFFTLFDFSAKWDPVPTMLCQNHTKIIHGFMGQTTAFTKDYIKSNVLIMGELKSQNEARYIHGELGQGTWTFYGGHDPEDYRHYVGDPKTELKLHPNSPGYRLILNNILFPAAKKKKKKT